MSDQGEFEFDRTPEGERDRILRRHEKRNPDLMDLAPGLVITYLKIYKKGTGEDIVDFCKENGVVPDNAKDDRAFGPVFMRLSKAKVILRVGFDPRRKGHAAPGASVWTLNEDLPV